MKAHEIRFVKDRIWFELNGKGARANHASIVVVFENTPVPVRPLIMSIPNCRVKA